MDNRKWNVVRTVQKKISENLSAIGIDHYLLYK